MEKTGAVTGSFHKEGRSNQMWRDDLNFIPEDYPKRKELERLVVDLLMCAEMTETAAQGE